MTAKDIRDFLKSLTSHITFRYHGKTCGVDPLAYDQFDMWYGDDAMTARSLDEVMKIHFFDGKSLTDIACEIQDLQM